MKPNQSSLIGWLAWPSSLVALLALGFGTANCAHASVTSIFTSANGAWSVSGNWNNGIPENAGDSAQIGSTTVAVTATNDIAVTLGTLTLSTTTSHAANVIAKGANVLTMNNNGSGALIEKVSASTLDTISSAIVLADNLQLYEGTSGNSGLMIGTAGGTKGITADASSRLISVGPTTQGSIFISCVIGDGSAGGNISLANNMNSSLVLSGVNTYSGSTSNNLGASLILSNSLALQNSTLTMNGGNLTFGGSATAYIFGGLASSSSGVGYDLGLTNNAGTPAAVALTIGNNNSSQSYAGVLGGSGSLIKVGTGTQTLSAACTYTGATTISNGSLTLTGSGSIANSTLINVFSNTILTLASALSLGSGQTLQGGGVVTGGSVTVGSGATLTAYNAAAAIGTLTFDSLTLNSGCTNNFAFSPVTNDLVNVTTSGGLTLSGGVFNLYKTNSTLPLTTLGVYNLFQYTGSLGGLDSTWTTPSATNPHILNPQPGLIYSFAPSGGHVQLTVSSTGSYWNINTGGSWNLAADWTPANVPNAVDTIVNFGNGGTAILAPSTVTLDGNQTVGALYFNSVQGFTINSGTPANSALTLDNGPANPTISDTLGGHINNAPIVLNQGVNISEAGGASLALNGAISDGANGPAALTNSGGGTLTLGGTNTYSGGTVLSTSTVDLNNAAALGTGPLTINATVTLDNTSGVGISNVNNNAQSWNNNFTFQGTTNLDLGAGAVTLSANRTVTVNSNTLAVDGVISGPTFTLTKAGAGQLTLTGNSTVTNVTISAGTLALNAAGGALPGAATVNLNGGTLNVAQADTITTFNLAASSTASGAGTLTVSSVINPNIATGNTNNIAVSLAGAAQFKKQGVGLTILSAANSYVGGTWINGSAGNELAIIGSGTLGSTSGALNMDTVGDILDLGTTTQTVGPVTVSGTITNGTLNAASFAVTNGFAYASLGGSGAPLAKVGPGTFVLAGANNYTGTTTVSAGTLQVDGSTATGSPVAVNGGTLTGTGTMGGSVTQASGANIAPGDNNVGALAISGNLTLNGGGYLSIAATNTGNYSKLNLQGNLNASGVTTILLPATPLPDGNYNLIGVYGNTNVHPANFSVASVAPENYQIAIVAGTPNLVQLQVSTPTLLTWIGDGFNNDWNTTDTGDWVNPPPTPATYADGDSVLFNDTASAANTTVNVQGTLSPLAVTVSNTVNNYVLADGGSGNISGAATLSKTGTKTLTIQTANSYTGATTISGGKISISADNNLGVVSPAVPTPGQLVLNGGYIEANQSFAFDPNRGITLGPPLSAGNGGIVAVGGQTLTCDNILDDNSGGTGSLLVNPTGANGTVILTGTNTYSGGTTVYVGTLVVSNDQSAASGGMSVGSVAGSGGPATLTIAAGANVAVASGNTFQIGSTGDNGPGANLDDSGTVTNNGSLIVARPANAQLNSGAVWVQNGAMTVAAEGATGGGLYVQTGATFTYNGTNTIKLNGGVGNTGIATNSIGGLFITGKGFEQSSTPVPTTGYGLLAFSGGTLRLSASIPILCIGTATNKFGPIVVTLTGNSTIDTGPNSTTITNAISGNGGLTKLGSGALTNSGPNSYKGNTSVGGGTLAIEQATLNTNSTITVSGGCALQLDFAKTNTVKALVLNGVSQPEGVVYNSGNSGGLLAGVGALYVPLSANANLTDFEVDNGGIALVMNPTFDGTLQAYSVNNAAGGPVTILITNSDLSANSTLYLNGTLVGPISSGIPSAPLALVSGSNNVVDVFVGSPDMSVTNDYQVSIGQPLSTNAYLGALVVSNNTTALNLTPAFTTINLGAYLATNANGAGPVTITVTNVDLTAVTSLYLNGAFANSITSGVPSVPLTLGGGSNSVVLIQVVSQDTTITNNYLVDIYQQNLSLSTNALLASLVFSNNVGGVVSLNPGFASSVNIYYATNTLPANQVNVTVADGNVNATNTLFVNSVSMGLLTASVNSSLQTLSPGSNNVTVQVVSQDRAHTNSYTVNVFDQPSLTLPKLTNSVSGGNLTLSWDPNHLGYRLLVQTNNQNLGVSKNANDWGTVAGSPAVTATNFPIPKTSSPTNEFYRLVYP